MFLQQLVLVTRFLLPSHQIYKKLNSVLLPKLLDQLLALIRLQLLLQIVVVLLLLAQIY